MEFPLINQALPSSQKTPAPEPEDSEAVQSVQKIPTQQSDSSQEYSALTNMAISYKLENLSYSEYLTQFSYTKADNSLALHAKSTTDTRITSEKITIDLTFSGEVLGLTNKDFAKNGGKPIQIQYITSRLLSKCLIKRSPALAQR